MENSSKNNNNMLKLLLLSLLVVSVLSCSSLQVKLGMQASSSESEESEESESENEEFNEEDVNRLVEDSLAATTGLTTRQRRTLMDHGDIEWGPKTLDDVNAMAEQLDSLNKIVDMVVNEVKSMKDKIIFGKNELDILRTDLLNYRKKLANGRINLDDIKKELKTNIERIALDSYSSRTSKIECQSCGKTTYVSRKQLLYLDNSIWGGPWHYDDSPSVKYPNLADALSARRSANGARPYSCVHCYKDNEISEVERNISKLERECQSIKEELQNTGNQLQEDINKRDELKKLEKVVKKKLETARKSRRDAMTQNERVASLLEDTVKKFPYTPDQPYCGQGDSNCTIL